MQTPFSEDSDIIIIIMGPTGSGKSTFINNVLGKTVVSVNHGLRSCTTKVQPVRCKHPSLPRNVVLVDTPGFDDTYLDDTEVLTRISNWLRKTYKNKNLITALLFFHRITDNRMPHSALRNLDVFKNVCGPGAFPNVVLITSMWDNLSGDEGEAREAEICKDFWKEILFYHAKTARLENTQQSAWNILDQSTGEPVSLLLQRELEDVKLSLPSTSAGRTLFAWVAESLLVKWCQSTIERLKKVAGREISVEVQRVRSLQRQIGNAAAQPTPQGYTHSPRVGEISQLSDISRENAHYPLVDSATQSRPDMVPPALNLLRATEDVLSVVLRSLTPTIPFIEAPINLILSISDGISNMSEVDKLLLDLVIDSGVLLRIIKEQFNESRGGNKKLSKILRDFIEELSRMDRVARRLSSASTMSRFFLAGDERQLVFRVRQLINRKFQELGMNFMLGMIRDVTYVKGTVKNLGGDMSMFREKTNDSQDLF